MNKTQFYLSQCVDAATKSTMYYRLGSVLVKGGKVISTGFNHQRPNYEKPGNGLPLSMHAEMACIFNATRGQAPALKQQVQPGKCTQQKSALRPAEAQRRDLERRRLPSRVSYQGKSRRAFYPSRHYHEEGQEAEPTYEQHGNDPATPCPGVRCVASSKKRARARHSRGGRDISGATLYVCRVTKDGFGCSKPCWRCVNWCEWAGVKRIFYWSVDEGRFVCLKVGAAGDQNIYQTAADTRFTRGRGTPS
ncbi:hypothetical protein B0H15DRAFT_938552 [Mycena belliarum]|uniref:CMP/dCMP-type deaminase domain-containing protein n=1 Tax=Mycena belliarum TaxID=1033014 RepID=A0AAD6U832_9AGAR|nr:hypothetical protein B0H15DRAFT_938552 [Mycena belliae]